MKTIRIMQKHLLLMCLTVLPFSLFAQEETNWRDLSFLAESETIQLKLDLSVASLPDNTLNDIYEEFCSKFNNAANKGDYPHLVGNYLDADNTMTIKYLDSKKESYWSSKIIYSVEISIVNSQNSQNEFYSKNTVDYDAGSQTKKEQFLKVFSILGNHLGQMVYLYATNSEERISEINSGIFDVENPENLQRLKDENKINFVLDYAGADILGADFEDWVESEAEWETYYKKIRSKFIQSFNNEAEHIRVGSYPDCKYTLTVHVLQVKDRGTDIRSHVFVKDNVGLTIYSKEMKSEDGLFGSALNLMGDSMADLGKKVGKVFFYNAK